MGSDARSAADVVRVRQRHTRGHDEDGLTGLEPCKIGGGQGERVVVRRRALDAVGLVGERTEVRDRYVEGVAVVASEIEAAATAGRLGLCGAVAVAVAAAAATAGQHQAQASATHVAKEEFARQHAGLLGAGFECRPGATMNRPRMKVVSAR